MSKSSPAAVTFKMKATPPTKSLVLKRSHSEPHNSVRRRLKLQRHERCCYFISPSKTNGEAVDPRMMDPTIYLPLMWMKRQRLMSRLSNPNDDDDDDEIGRHDATVMLHDMDDAAYRRALPYLLSIGYRHLEPGQVLRQIGVEVLSRGPPDGLIYLTNRRIHYFEYSQIFTMNHHTFYTKALRPCLIVAPMFSEEVKTISTGCQQWMQLVELGACNAHSLMSPLMGPPNQLKK